ncbi:hypothetical protein G9A89_016571 [Geosiphon pyriformis]|nr:hypothetical protein G9A89_016571 [Geosiphon pyriformis]
MVVHQPIPNSYHQPAGSHSWNSGTGSTQNPNSQNYLSLLVTSEDATSNNLETNQQATLTSNISPATVTNNESLAAIFPFELEEPFQLPLFSEAALKEKPITVMYTNAKVDGHPIKLILDSVDRAASTKIITADGATKMPIGEIDNFPIKINGIVTSIKVLVMEATQYQALVNNDWLTTQKLQLTTCGHFKTTNLLASLIDFKEEKTKPIWEAYQNDNSKGKQKEELTWEIDDLIWTDNEQKEPSSWKWKEKKRKGKEKKEENTPVNNTYISYTYGQQQSSTYCQPKLICVNCDKKLLSIGTCCGNNEEYSMATKFYCCPCILKHFGRPKRVGKWDNTSCLACEKTLLDEGIWNNIPEHGEACDKTC